LVYDFAVYDHPEGLAGLFGDGVAYGVDLCSRLRMRWICIAEKGVPARVAMPSCSSLVASLRRRDPFQ
jgi:hypothetical protein